MYIVFVGAEGASSGTVIGSGGDGGGLSGSPGTNNLCSDAVATGGTQTCGGSGATCDGGGIMGSDGSLFQGGTCSSGTAAGGGGGTL